MIQTATDTVVAPFQWGPIILLVLGLIAGAVAFFFKSILTTLATLTGNVATISTTIAVMQEHASNADSDIQTVTKYHDEIMEHKAALRELNYRVTKLDGQDESFGMTVPRTYRDGRQ